nr:class I SAM-dependent methyltransferase [Tissierella sp.]
MRYRLINNTVSIAKTYIENYIKKGQIVLDATVGNGNDTKLLADKVGADGKVYGFDIQRLAIENTRKLLKENNLDKQVQLIIDSHENLEVYIHEGLDFIIYNLGYLPKGDKNIVTQSESTLKSIESSLKLLNPNGLLLINSYIGHDGGRKENQDIEIMLKSLNQKRYNVLKHNFINQKNTPPILYIIEKSL